MEVMSERAATGALAAISVAAALMASACTAAAPDVALSPVAEEGRDLARGSGCAACHGRNGEGGVGPAWKGLAGSTVSFTDATTTVVDADYLTTSILDPSAQLREGFALQMPENNLSEEDVAKIVAYIEELR